jgi:hypothetical protein
MCTALTAGGRVFQCLVAGISIHHRSVRLLLKKIKSWSVDSTRNIKLKVIGQGHRIVAHAAVVAFDKIPNHLCGQLHRLAIVIEVGVYFINTNRSQLIAQAGIASDLAKLFTRETVWRGLDDEPERLLGECSKCLWSACLHRATRVLFLLKTLAPNPIVGSQSLNYLSVSTALLSFR